MKRQFFIFFFLFYILHYIFLPVDSALADKQLIGQSDHIPWSGYWWPLTKGEIVNGYRGSPRPSPLEKYDLYASGAYPGAASSWELVNKYDPSGELWWGYCNGWANATVLENVDISVSAQDGIFFNIGDKKGLLTLLHSDDMVIIKYCNSPLYFHQYLLEYIGENKIPIVADLDMTGELWSYPIYRYEMSITELSEHDDIQCRILYATDDVEPDFTGTETRYETYYYRLLKDEFGNYTAGQWTGISQAGHPEKVWVPISQGADNPNLDYQTVKDIVATSGDDLDKTEVFAPGHYAIIVSPGETDTVSIDLPATGNLVVKVVLDPQSRQGMTLPQYTMRKGEDILSSGDISDTVESIEIESIPTNNRTYELSITANSGNEYTDFIHLYIDITFNENMYFLQATNNNYWEGIAVCNNQEPANTFYATYLKSGNKYPVATIPLNSYLDLNANITRVLDKSWVPHDYYSEGDTSILRISSQYPMELIGLRGDSRSLFGPPDILTNSDDSSGTLVIPDLTYVFNFSAEASLVLHNQGTSSIDCEIDYYTDSGSLKKEYSWTFPREHMETYPPGKYPDSMDFDGWAVLNVSSGNLQGNVKLLASQLSDEIPFLKPATVLYMPLLAVCEGWNTTLTLFNTSENKADFFLLAANGTDKKELIIMSLDPFEKKEVDVTTVFSDIDDSDFCNSWLKIASYSEIAGFGTYQHNDTARASFQLYTDNDFSTDINLGLSASDTEIWWTGVLLLNTNEAPVSVSISGYAENGNLIKSVTRTINAEENLPITVEQLFPINRLTINSLRIHADLPIGGFALYGNKDINYLSGILIN